MTSGMVGAASYLSVHFPVSLWNHFSLVLPTPPQVLGDNHHKLASFLSILSFPLHTLCQSYHLGAGQSLTLPAAGQRVGGDGRQAASLSGVSILFCMPLFS